MKRIWTVCVYCGVSLTLMGCAQTADTSPPAVAADPETAVAPATEATPEAPPETPSPPPAPVEAADGIPVEDTTTDAAAETQIATAPDSAVQCGLDGGFDHETRHDGTRRVMTGEGALAFRSNYAVNTDGAPTSYHPDDLWGSKGLAINTVCNGVNITAPESVNYANCNRLVELFSEAIEKDWTGEDSPRVSFYGIATEGASGDARFRPCINDKAPYEGYFVSTTSLAADKSLGRCDQDRYLNSLDLPFIIRPNDRDFSGNGVDIGDIAYVYDPTSGRSTYAIVGDVGPGWGLGEGSVYISRVLTGASDNPKKRRDTYGYGAKDVVTVIFTETRLSAPITLDQINAAGETAMAEFGGEARIKACADVLP